MTSDADRAKPVGLGGVALLALSVAMTGCTSSGATGTSTPSSAPSSGGSGDRVAERLAQVTSVHEATGATLLEGPVFGADGGLYLTDVTAPPGEPKVLRVDTETGEAEPVFTDDTSVVTSAQFSPTDDRLYLTDFGSGSILSIAPDGSDPVTEFSGPVEGSAMHPDDLTFDEAGNMYVTDSSGYDAPSWEASGRVVRIDGASGEATVLARDLAAPNGIAFSPEFDALWVTENTGNRVHHLVLDEAGTAVTAAHPALSIDGGVAQVDSAAVDADGNVYLGMHNRPAILVYSAFGEHVSTIEIPKEDAADGLSSATNIAIAPGTSDAYITVSGSAGGFVYTADALAKGIRASNGG